MRKSSNYLKMNNLSPLTSASVSHHQLLGVHPATNNGTTNDSPQFTTKKDSCGKSFVFKEENSTSNPASWGPAFWFSLHNGASKYPSVASPLCKENTKNFILGIPYFIPCDDCAAHARNYILEKEPHLMQICSGRESLFSFFVDMHNYVNKRYQKPELSIQQAKEQYNF